ncbi:hypothetical protein JXA63_00740 [Candidatus Woesebacteria bacterium]|nr:hypothetical protein [Candidatus Woesebacteria bacterium]
MRIILVHGDNLQKSYERLGKFIDSAKKREWVVERFNANDKIQDILVSQSLFGEKKLFILEDAEKLDKNKLKWMKGFLDDIEGTLVIYSGKTLTKTFINSLPKIDKIENFELPKIIWSFLDSLYPGNSTNSLKMFNKLIETDAPEFIFTLIVRQVRDMYYLKIAPESIDYPSWRKNKLTAQMRKYKDGQLERFLKKLAEADMKTKTSVVNITDLLDYIIISELE